MNIIEKDIRPIPKAIIQKIKKQTMFHAQSFIAYLTKIKGELAKVIVATKYIDKQWFCKQVAVHVMHSENCLVKDIEYCLMGYYASWGSHYFKPNRAHSDHWCSAENRYYNPDITIVNPKFALTLDKYKYSQADKYPYPDLMTYLELYEAYPQAEYLIKLGLGAFATKKSLLKLLKNDKNFRKYIVRNAKFLRNEYGNYPYYTAESIIFSYKHSLDVVEGGKLHFQLKRFMQDIKSYQNTLKGIVKNTQDAYKLLTYINSQNTGLASYNDYIKACIYLNLDLTQEKNVYPHNFRYWHDTRINQYNSAKMEEDKQKRQAFYGKFLEIANKYASLERTKDNLLVIIAKSPAELINEGNILQHCVGRMGYDQKFANEESLIFFVRNKDNPDQPYVTLEYSLKRKKILQCYGIQDTKPEQEVLDFVNKTWLPYANRKLKKLVA